MRFRFLWLLLLLPFVPLLVPWVYLLTTNGFEEVWSEGSRIFQLGKTTALLIVGSGLLALPLGIVLSVLLYRTDLPGRMALRGLILLSLFIPMPLLVAGWRWTGLVGRFGAVPELSAMALHAIAALPWIVILLGQALCRVERELEEEALLSGPPLRVICRVTLPRCRAALVLCSAWVAIAVFTEVAITNLLQVRTYAEEIYLQFIRPEPGSVLLSIPAMIGRGMALTLPAFMALALIGGFALRSWSRNFSQGEGPAEPYRFGVGRWKWFWAVLVFLVVGFFLGAPWISLLWKAGQQLPAATWAPGLLLERLLQAIQVEGWGLLRHLLVAVTVGGLTALLALLCCWAALERAWLRALVLVVAILCWTLPGPVVGLVLKQSINAILDLTDSPWLATLLYYGPSPAPVIWAQVIRLFPFAVALLWPLLRSIPRELIEMARVEGATPFREVRWVLWPWMRTAFWRTVLIIGALSLGEISASKLVSTAGGQTFAEDLFVQMHYSLGPDLAARCLLLLAIVAAAVLIPWRRQDTRS